MCHVSRGHCERTCVKIQKKRQNIGKYGVGFFFCIAHFVLFLACVRPLRNTFFHAIFILAHTAPLWLFSNTIHLIDLACRRHVRDEFEDGENATSQPLMPLTHVIGCFWSCRLRVHV
jgi:hypothetical protein